LTTGAYNTAFGYNAGNKVTTGGYNVLVGGLAGDAITTGNYNTIIGRNAMAVMTNQSSCVAVGINAMENCLTGSGANTAMGDTAGSVLTTGTHNTFLGYHAAVKSDGNVDSVGCVIIGAASKATGSLSNSLGYNLTAEAGYTTVGASGNDIRAAHGNVTWATVSDERVKKDIEDSTAGLSFINDLRPRTFNYKFKGDLPEEFKGYEEGSTESYKNNQTNHGFIAQEVKTVIDNHTELTDGFKMWDVRDTGQQEVAETALIPMLVKAIQELSAEVKKLKGE